MDKGGTGSPSAARDHGRLAPMNGKVTTNRTRLERGRSALGPALELVHTGRAPTRAVLTAELGVTRATAGAVAAELESLGLIQVDSRPAAAGFPGQALAPAVGQQQRPRRTRGPGARGRLPCRAHRARRPGGRHLARLCHGLRRPRAGPRRGRRRGGRAVARQRSALRRRGARGAVGRRRTGRHRAQPLHLAWPAGAPVRDIFADRVRAAGITGPAFTGNDVNLAALAEHRHGAGRSAHHLLCVATGHRGVGGALVVDGRLHTGSSGLALEVGHVTVNPEGRACYCGSRGCLDVETDPLAFLTAAGRAPGPEGSLLQQSRDILRTEYDDPGVRIAAQEIVDRLGLGLAGLVNILNPDRIILGGLHRELLDADPERLRAVVADRSLWGRSGGVPILPCTLDHNSLVGAAELAWQPVLDDPLSIIG